MTRISSIVVRLLAGGFLTTAMAAFGQQCDILFQGTPVVSPDPVTVDVAGRDITVSYVIYNNGPGSANNSSTSIKILTPSGDLLVQGDFPAPEVSANDNFDPQYCTLTIPAGTPAGTYTVYVGLDVNFQLDESDRDNDYSNVGFTVVNDSTPLSIYYQDFSSAQPGDTTFGDGSQLFSTSLGNVTAVAGNPKHDLRLTEADVTDVRAAFAPPLLYLTNFITAFSAKWNTLVDGNFPNAADGFSFNFGPLAIDSSLISTNQPQESGYTNGLAFSVQTYTGNAPGFYLRLNGATIASSSFNPTVEWGNYGSVQHFFEADWGLQSGMTVRMDGQTIFTNVPTTGFVPQIGDRFVWAARCGGLTEDLRLDNVLVVAGANLEELAVGPPYFNNAGGSLPANAFDGNGNTAYSAQANAGYVGGTLAVTSSVCAYAITTSSNTDLTTDPGQWTLQGSGDGGVTWSGANPTTSGSFVVPSETLAWAATNTTSYSAWRLNMLANSGSTNTLLAGLHLYQAVPGVPYFAANADQGNFGYVNSGSSQIQPQSFVFTVYPNGAATTVTFQWGATSGYGNTFTTNLPPANGPITVTVPLGLPEGGQDYHYRITLQNAGGVLQGADQVFSLPAWIMLDARTFAGDYTPQFFPADTAVIAADFNGDGKMDLFNQGDAFEYYGDDPSGTLEVPQNNILINNFSTNPPSEGAPITAPPLFASVVTQNDTAQNDPNRIGQGAVAVDDFNNDNRLDIFVDGWAAAYDENGQPYFSLCVDGAQLYPGYEPKIDPDEYDSGHTRPLTFNNGTLTSLNLPKGGFCDATVADFNGDGRPDVLLSGTYSQCADFEAPPPDPVTMSFNRAHGSLDSTHPGLDQVDFTPAECGLPLIPRMPAQYEMEGGTYAADYDNDGAIDIYIADNGLFHNDGYGRFTLMTNSLPTNGLSAAWGDYDNDGLLDVALSFASEIRIYHNDGGGHFTDTGWSIPNYPGDLPTLVWVDLNHRGYPDLFTHRLLQKELFRNNHGAITNQPESLPIGSLDYAGHAKTTIAFADLNGDGRLDFANTPNFLYDDIPTQVPTSLYITLNMSGTSNSPPGAPDGLSSSTNAGSVTLNWGSATDETTPSSGLTYNVRVGTTAGGCDIVGPLALTNGLRLVSRPGNHWEAHTTTLRLPPGTYYWSVQAIDGGFLGGPFASEQTFTVTGYQLPVCYPATVSNIATNSADVSATIWTSYQNASCWVEYGMTTNYGLSLSTNVATNAPFDGNISPTNVLSIFTPPFALTGLQPGTTYHFRYGASNSVGVGYSPDAVFTTPGTPPPTLIGTLNPGTITLSWTNSEIGFTLQETHSLTAGLWTAVPVPQTTNNGMIQVTAPTGSAADFFRLRK
jgi:hypothetical protein